MGPALPTVEQGSSGLGVLPLTLFRPRAGEEAGLVPAMGRRMIVIILRIMMVRRRAAAAAHLRTRQRQRQQRRLLRAARTPGAREGWAGSRQRPHLSAGCARGALGRDGRCAVVARHKGVGDGGDFDPPRVSLPLAVRSGA
eukprot:scaffold582_cov385-Prasinococcus_capsulatus_cf.AAC.10